VNPWITGATGKINVWRQLTIEKSFYGGGVVNPALAGRTHPGDGPGMDVARFNRLCKPAFNEWVVPPQVVGGDPHRAVNKTDYRNAVNGLNGTGNGAVNLTAVGQINDEFVRWDHFRVQLPPDIDADRHHVVCNAIHALAARSTSIQAAQAAIAAMNARDLVNPAVDTDVASVGAVIPIFPGSDSDYENWVDGKVDGFNAQLLDTLLGELNPPRVMNTIRWPNGYQRFWNNGDYYGAGMNTTTLSTAGAVGGNGQSYYYTVGGNLDTFEHEMGHSVHLAHFSDGNCAWKHHDLNYVICIMSYYSGDNYILKPTGAVGAWTSVDPGTGDDARRLFTNNNREDFCGKCHLKMRGWKEDVIPCDWENPDLF